MQPGAALATEGRCEYPKTLQAPCQAVGTHLYLR